MRNLHIVNATETTRGAVKQLSVVINVQGYHHKADEVSVTIPTQRDYLSMDFNKSWTGQQSVDGGSYVLTVAFGKTGIARSLSKNVNGKLSIALDRSFNEVWAMLPASLQEWFMDGSDGILPIEFQSSEKDMDFNSFECRHIEYKNAKRAERNVFFGKLNDIIREHGMECVKASLDIAESIGYDACAGVKQTPESRKQHDKDFNDKAYRAGGRAILALVKFVKPYIK